ncbi:DUF4214 domain-containing protein [Stutzerimonas kunmingensis]|uniref:DUF4214 domain-containing protein n=1 Tax=Stutzerimonas kunmingensis TaxID=1211807 RepID=UPI0028975A8D|nr:DUF4214 domain-containing protein [Stutzerimonas kunmingensis]
MAITAQQVQELYIAYLGRPADKAGLDYWMAELNAEPAVLTLEDLRANFVNEQPEYANTYGGLSTAQIVAKIYENLFGREGEADGLAYWTGEVQSGNVPVDMLLVAFLNGASEADRAVVDQKVEDAMAELPTDPTDPVEPGNPGETFAFTDGRDTLTGTSADDTFVGFVGQNQDGSIANAFATGDYVDGGAGRDKIVVTLQEDQKVDDGADAAVNARTVNVEEIHIEALGDVTVDAGRMDSIREYWSDNSTGGSNLTGDTLTITDVRLGSKLGITKDITFGLRETDYNSNFVAELDSQSFKAAPDVAQNSSLVVRIADVSTETPATPLANVNLNLNFKLGGQLISLTNVRSTDGSYAGLQSAIDSALAAAGHSGLAVELSTPYNEVTVAGNTVTLPFTAQEIVVTDPNGAAISDVNFTYNAIAPVADGFLVAGNAAPADPSVTSNLIESNLILDNAGRGSIAGDVTIGGMSNSNHGIEQFNVSVDRDSKIASLNTTNDTLQNIVITSEGAKGSLYLGATQANLVEIDANAFQGAELSLGEGAAIANLANLDAAGTAADVTFIGANTDGLQAALNTGSGDDAITLSLTGVSASFSTETAASINAGAGDNVVVLNGAIDGYDNAATVITGSGADVITGGANSLTVNSGAGNDVIYAENTGAMTVARIDAGVFAGVLATTAVGGNAVPVAEIGLLHDRDVRVTLGLPGAVLADAFADGLEVTVKVQASTGYLTTERDLYNAVRDAINNDPVLNKLAEASVDSNGHLTVEYLVDGATLVGDEIVSFEVLGTWADVAAATKTNITNALKAEYSDSSIVAADVEAAYNAAADEDYVEVITAGTASPAGDTVANVVNAGLGNDVIVLSTNAVDTLEFDAGQFGNDTVAHFNAGAAGDVLDFTAFLNNVTSASGSVESQVRIDTSLVTAAGAVGANDVVVVGSAAVGAFANDAAFEAFTGANLLTALKAAGGWTVEAADPELVGTVQKSVFMVENQWNLGEYKVFEVSATADATNENFTAVTLVGSLDFAETQAFVLANFA